MNNVKSVFLSKTFQLAALQAVAGGLLIFAGTYPTLGWIAIAKSFVDIVLRMMTVQPVSFSGK